MPEDRLRGGQEVLGRARILFNHIRNIVAIDFFVVSFCGGARKSRSDETRGTHIALRLIADSQQLAAPRDNVSQSGRIWVVQGF